MVGDINAITARPERMVLYRTRGYRLVMNTGGKPVFRVDAPAEVTWLTGDAKPLPPEEAEKTYVLCPAVGGILCLRCNRLSQNDNDVANRYCGYCKRVHVDAVPV